MARSKRSGASSGSGSGSGSGVERVSGLGAAWYRSVKTASRSGMRVERAFNDPAAALRSGLGVAIALFGALAWLGPTHAVLPALGAQLTGMTNVLPGYRRGPGLTVATALGLFASAFVGNAVAPWPALFVLVLAVWAFGAAMFWALGTAQGIAAAMTVPVMLTIVRAPRDVADAVQFALLIGAGGAVQVALALAWPDRSWNAQRAALADACASVADYARRLSRGRDAVFDPNALAQARAAATLTPRQARRRPSELSGIRVLMDEVRAVLLALADAGKAMPDAERAQVRDLLDAAAGVLDTAARSIRTGAVVPPSTALLTAMEQAARNSLVGESAGDAAEKLIDLLSQVDAVLRETEESEDAEREGQATNNNRNRSGILHRPDLRQRLAQARRTVRHELRRDSPILRHALRVAVVVAVTDGISKLLNVQHGYWAALTVMMVMRPDFSQTFSRGVARFAGTLVGVALASTVVLLSHPDPWVAAALAAACTGALYLVMQSGYLVASTLITAYIVFLLSMDGLALASTVRERVALTLLGGLIIFSSYALWPSWQTVTLAGRLADLIEATGRYAASTIEAVAEPGPARRRRAREALLDSRDAYLALESAALAAAQEPVRDRGPSREGLTRAHRALARLFEAAVIVQAHQPPGDEPPRPAGSVFAHTLRDALLATATQVRHGQTVTTTDFDGAAATWKGANDGTSAAILRDASRLAAEATRLQELLTALDTAPPAATTPPAQNRATQHEPPMP
ncbi:FUSC family protein [Catenulispora pinisilvae]|uniref:FUSC family protein n=1 Tax=Catenulispora pinisilvae TaxID=2705253 RepID=UPI001892692F|nr:FUSC family protein [Catenulispora pinisilvae]